VSLMQYNFPYKINEKGRTQEVSEQEHIRQLIKQVLFTSQGERVNRPDFGTSLEHMLFSSNSDELASATQLLVQGSLQRWLGDLITVEFVEVKNDDSKLYVTVQYRIKLNQQQQQTALFVKEVH
jgi:phage baseplate assembly protein W